MAPRKRSAASKSAALATESAHTSSSTKQSRKRVSFTDANGAADSDIEVDDTDYALPADSKLKKRGSATTQGDEISRWVEIIADTMSAQGPVCNILHLTADGKLHTMHADMTPTANTVNNLLGGSATFVGELPAPLNAVVAVRRDQTSTTLPVNKHTLPAPFSQGYASYDKKGKESFAPVRGDIVIVRMDKDAVPTDLSEAEYTKYCQSAGSDSATSSDGQPAAKRAKTASTKSSAKKATKAASKKNATTAASKAAAPSPKAASLKSSQKASKTAAVAPTKQAATKRKRITA